MPLPQGVTVGEGRRRSVSQRGYFTKFPDGSRHYTACRFAGGAQVLERVGWQLPLIRRAPGPNAVAELQRLGDPTPQNGSTLAQLKAAIAAYLPDASVAFGVMSESEILEAVAGGASVSVSVDMGQMPRRLRRFCGYGYTGRHVVTFDATSTADPNTAVVAMTDPMHRPARDVRPQSVRFRNIVGALVRNARGVIVTVGQQGADYPLPAPPTPPTCEEQLAAAKADLEASAQELADVTEERDNLLEWQASVRSIVCESIPGEGSGSEGGS